MIQREAEQKLLRADAPVDQVDVETVCLQNAIPVLELLRRDEFAVVTFGPEVVAEDLVFAAPSWAAELEDRDVGLPGCTRKHLVSLQQCLQKRLLAANTRERIFAAELLHGRTVIQQVR